MTLNPFRWSFRALCFLGFATCAALIGFALFSQTQWGLEPCPLCIFQRVAFAVTGLVFLVAGLHAPRGRPGRVAYGLLALLASGTGAAIAGRHVWLQHLPPDQVPACGPGLEYMMEAMPFLGVLRKVLTGSGECAVVDWSFAGLSMPAWSLVWFVLLALLALRAAFTGRASVAMGARR
jgi:protein dithiol:quinone oxidoreductase